MSQRGIYYFWAMIAGDDERRIFTLYDDSEATSLVDLSGCTGVAWGVDADGTNVWTGTVTLGDALGTIQIDITDTITADKAGERGTWKVQITWTDGKEWSPLLGNFKISTPVISA